MGMKRIARHTWLFSFTDVAFLLLLVWTQLARMSSPTAPVAEMQLPAPVVANNPELTALKSDKDHRQVLIEKHSDRPYRLTRIVGGNEISRSDPMSFAELNAALQGVFNERTGAPPPGGGRCCRIRAAARPPGAAPPVVVPLPESYSSDLL